MYYTHDEIIEMTKAQAGYDFQPRTGVGIGAKAIADATSYRPSPPPSYDNSTVLHESGSGGFSGAASPDRPSRLRDRSFLVYMLCFWDW